MGPRPGGKHIRVRTSGQPHHLRQATPFVDVSLLSTELARYVREFGVNKSFELGVYKKLLLGQAVRGKALADLWLLVMALLSVCPQGLFKHGDLKKSLINVGLQFEGLADPCRPLERWASDLAERIFVIMNHVRRISQSSIRWRQCIRTVDQETERVLERMKNIVEPPLPVLAPLDDVSPDDSISQVSIQSMKKPLAVALTTAKPGKFYVVHGESKSYIQTSGTKKDCSLHAASRSTRTMAKSST